VRDLGLVAGHRIPGTTADMVASAGIKVSGTVPKVLTHQPVGAAVDTYDFDGSPAKIYLIQMSCFRKTGVSHRCYLTMQDGTVIQLLQLGGGTPEDVVLTECVTPCLTVPAGTVFTWDHAASFYSLLMTFDLQAS
jgi:hypothetical protein